MNLSDVSAYGAPTGALAVGIVRWLPADEVEMQLGQPVSRPGVERTDYLVKTTELGFQYVGHGTVATWVRWENVQRAEVWYW